MQHDLVMRATQPADGVVAVHLGGVVDAHTLDKFEAGLEKALKLGGTSLVLDCEELRYVNSAGFGELIRYFDRLKEEGGVLVLARVPPKVGIILEMLGLKSLIPITTTMPEAIETAKRGAAAAEQLAAEAAPAETAVTRGAVGAPAQGRLPAMDDAPRIRAEQPVVTADKGMVVCAFCDARLRIGGEGRWACPACGAPFTMTREGGLAFDWARADADAMHVTLDVTARTLAGLAGMLEGILVERRVPHARMRRFAREAAHVCHLIHEHAFEPGRTGPLHVLALAGPQRLNLRIVDRGKNLADDVARIFAAQSRLFLDFSYASPAPGLNVTEFAFAYAGSGVFVG